MRYLNAADTRAALPMPDAIEAMEHAFSGESESPLRTLVGNSLVMPGRLDDIMAVKVVSTVPGKPDRPGRGLRRRGEPAGSGRRPDPDRDPDRCRLRAGHQPARLRRGIDPCDARCRGHGLRPDRGGALGPPHREGPGLVAVTRTRPGPLPGWSVVRPRPMPTTPLRSGRHHLLCHAGHDAHCSIRPWSGPGHTSTRSEPSPR